jgi:glycosyltransferase involved in cell wall biosynthesis
MTFAPSPLSTPKSTPELSIVVIIPAFNEASSISTVLEHIPSQLPLEAPHCISVIVVDNNSTDDTAERAGSAGALVVHEARRGYGSACLRGIATAAMMLPKPDIVVFLDGDYSDTPEEMAALVPPVAKGEVELMIGSRVLGIRCGKVERGALLPQARFGNTLATRLIAWLWGVHFTDLGPFRVITWEALEHLQMADTNFGWTVEMQIKAALYGLRCAEVPVSYRKRVGVSKITGTISGTIKAGTKILWTIARFGLFHRYQRAGKTFISQRQHFARNNLARNNNEELLLQPANRTIVSPTSASSMNG